MSQLVETTEPAIQYPGGYFSQKPIVLSGNAFLDLSATTGTTKLPSATSINGISLGNAQVLASAATISLTQTNQVITHTPTQSETINLASVPSAGTEMFLVITTSGTSAFTLTFGTNFKSQGTLSTGTVTAKVFVVSFVSDGVNLNEESRTTAM